MIEEVSIQNETIKPGLGDRLKAWGDRWQPWAERLTTTRSLCYLIVFFTILVMIGYKPFKHGVGGDTAVYDYIAQRILQGELPYRDIADIKFPGCVYINAAAMWVGGLFGLKDVYALRIMQILEFATYNVFTFLVGMHYLRRRSVGLVAMMIPLMSPYWARWILTGSQPKLPMMMFGMITLWFIAKDKPFWAGFAGMMSCLCWQPGLLFVGTAGLVCSNYLRNWRDLRMVKVVAGAAIPAVVLFGYFGLMGALDDLWAWTMEYNYSVFGPKAQRTLYGSWLHLNRVLNRIFKSDVYFVYLAVIGFFIFVFERLRSRRKGLEKSYADGQFRDAIILPVVVYFAFTMINMQAGPDLIPYFPFIGLFLGYFFVKLGEALGALLKKPHIAWTAWASGLALVFLTGVVMWRAATFKVTEITIKDQYTVFQPYRDMLQEGDKLYVHGTIEMLVLFHLKNLNPYILLDWGADEFAAHKRGMTFEQVIEEMEAQKPKLVFLTRVKGLWKEDAFRKWVAEHYTETDTESGIFIRKE